MRHGQLYKTLLADMLARGYVPASVLAKRWGVSSDTVKSLRQRDLIPDVEWHADRRTWFYPRDAERPPPMPRGPRLGHKDKPVPVRSQQIPLEVEWAVWPASSSPAGKGSLGWLG